MQPLIVKWLLGYSGTSNKGTSPQRQSFKVLNVNTSASQSSTELVSSYGIARIHVEIMHKIMHKIGSSPFLFFPSVLAESEQDVLTTQQKLTADSRTIEKYV